MKSSSLDPDYKRIIEQEHRDKIRIHRMMVTLDRVDAWLVRGFSGISDVMIERASQGEYSEEVAKSIDSAIEQLERCINYRQHNLPVDVDKVLVAGLGALCQSLHRRCYDLGINELENREREALRIYVDRLRIAKNRFKEKLDARQTSEKEN